ncbi:copper resistance protein NlpE [Shewanella sp. Isolate11]|uniref:copper resistance protein NlpE n=1 Tax=Shewanella sp. Isolate11 TaxID=2908530 RepID=UPI001EFD8264|nr:copper resistance protein NlpE [Shewanella sp. Isolate11]MCG9697656.1 copper resistance protein NlpE [Shewanella sp. Isolate11]
MKKIAWLLPLLWLALSACSSSDNMAIGDNSQNALDWPGVYAGELPCGNCKATKVFLQINSDNTYELTLREEDLDGRDQAPTIQQGTFTWSKSGSTITLDRKVWPKQFLVGENQLFMLDDGGKRITGDLAAKYRLIKD